MNTRTSKSLVTEPPVCFMDGAMAKLDGLRRDFTAGEAVARAADFPKPKAAALA